MGEVTKNCPHRIRVRRLIADIGYEHTGSYICALVDMKEFGTWCTDDNHKNCYLPAMTEAQRIKRLKDMGQQELNFD